MTATAALVVSPTVPTDARLRFSGVLRSEFVKLTSLRSTAWSLGLIVLIGLGSSLLFAFTMEAAGIPSEPSARFTLGTVAFGGVMFGQLVAAVLGVLTITAEYSTGTIQPTLAAVPSRLPVLAAKVIVLFGVVTTTGLFTLFGSWAATYPLFDALGLATGLGTPGLTTALLGGALQLGLTAVFALGIGTFLRSAAAGVATVLGVLLLLPVLLSVLSGSIGGLTDLFPYLPSAAGEAMSTVPPAQPYDGMPLPPAMGALVLLGWTAATLVVGALALRKRDA